MIQLISATQSIAEADKRQNVFLFNFRSYWAQNEKKLAWLRIGASEYQTVTECQ